METINITNEDGGEVNQRLKVEDDLLVEGSTVSLALIVERLAKALSNELIRAWDGEDR